jgi:sec-independent protein translocase protein TatA
MRLGWPELIIILIIAFVIFGGTRLSGIGRALGKGIKDFKSEVKSETTSEAKSESESEEILTGKNLDK